ncbi:CPBP family intramembrane glutamic endopeptidase [Sutcliffiella rhizosphaerae]|uniref:Membrane-embedded CAAX protease MroQ n=1 Tax=Sutcliffiella rhizosphaerae TaxID=2880967 RepID=A0ABM8YU90_9BACI|nr:type II CAAX endopeptidase family protein [Sutcliffiella rhizosphaerae]CAG9623536.1 Membrane-embedded CAAX protease MroQ [Sutcliffiella rhizosphaerae]
MTKNYWYVILTYVVMQFSIIGGFPLLVWLGIGEGMEDRQAYLIGYWSVISFTVALIIVCWILRKEWTKGDFRGEPSPLAITVLWSMLGFPIALIGQAVAGLIQQQVFGIQPGSENTQQIMGFVSAFPLMIFAVAVAGPILEEIIFRKIIFGAIYKRFNFAAGLIVSSLLFAVVHQDFKHLLVYFVMGGIFAFLYVKTNRIIVPIIAHVGMNSFVVIVQYVFREDIERMIKQMEEMQQNLPQFISFF